MESKFDHELIVQLRASGRTWEQVGALYSSSANSAEASHRQWKTGRKSQTTAPPRAGMPVVGRATIDENIEKGTATTVIYVENKPKNLEEHMLEYGIDTDIWQVKQMTTNNWQGWGIIEGEPRIVDLYQIKIVWFARPGVETGKKIIDAVLKKAKKKAPKFRAVKPKKGVGILALNIPDLHLGKLSWAPETDENYDIKIANKCFSDALLDLGDQAKGAKPGVILVPIGNDFLNSDGPQQGKGAFTANGTAQDEDGRWQKSFEQGVFMTIDAIERLSGMHPKAEIIIDIVPGNHDTQRIFYLGLALQLHFNHHNRIRVNSEPTMRKFFCGIQECDTPVAIMMMHGDKVKPASWVGLMAKQFDLRRYATREIFTGHLHHQRGMRFDTYVEQDEILARQFPSLSPADSWHAQNGYCMSQRAAQAIYYRPDGRVGNILHHYPVEA